MTGDTEKLHIMFMICRSKLPHRQSWYTNGLLGFEQRMKSAIISRPDFPEMVGGIELIKVYTYDSDINNITCLDKLDLFCFQATA